MLCPWLVCTFAFWDIRWKLCRYIYGQPCILLAKSHYWAAPEHYRMDTNRIAKLLFSFLRGPALPALSDSFFYECYSLFTYRASVVITLLQCRLFEVTAPALPNLYLFFHVARHMRLSVQISSNLFTESWWTMWASEKQAWLLLYAHPNSFALNSLPFPYPVLYRKLLSLLPLKSSKKLFLEDPRRMRQCMLNPFLIK